mgnify:FL=1|jgi:hypothetical protein
MNTVSGINPKTNKKETYQFKNDNDGFWKAQDKLQELEKLGYKKAEHTGETLLSSLLKL